MKQWFICCLLVVGWGCQQPKVDLSGDTPVKASDFIAAFPPITNAITIADTNLAKKSDTTVIGVKALKQFIPDSVATNILGKDAKIQVRAVGLIDKVKEKYFLFNLTQKKKTKLVVLVTDKKLGFLAAKELLSNSYTDGYSHFVSINKEPTFIISREKTNNDNSLSFTRAGWVYNDAGIFMVVINDSNEDPLKTAIINPIDTLAKLNKYSGDYVRNDKNYISLRDGKDANNYLFFIHFEKNNGSCVGELKGDMKLTTPKTAQFTQSGDPCIIDFAFEGNYIKVKEQGSCGNHRGIKCFFDDSFRKKKEPKPKSKKKK